MLQREIVYAKQIVLLDSLFSVRNAIFDAIWQRDGIRPSVLQTTGLLFFLRSLPSKSMVADLRLLGCTICVHSEKEENQ
jgi:hypothetical protein